MICDAYPCIRLDMKMYLLLTYNNISFTKSLISSLYIIPACQNILNFPMQPQCTKLCLPFICLIQYKAFIDLRKPYIWQTITATLKWINVSNCALILTILNIRGCGHHTLIRLVRKLAWNVQHGIYITLSEKELFADMWGKIWLEMHYIIVGIPDSLFRSLIL